ncbi:MAG: hypothetical protein RIQ53_1342 [Pseudomonadota bacterium]|jgi:ribosomal-protein-alanine N-acetyltransferase
MNPVAGPGAAETGHGQPLAGGRAQHLPMLVADVERVMAVEVTAYSHPWTRGNFVDSLAAGHEAELRLGPDGRLQAYQVTMPGVEECHLLNLTVAPVWQRRGLGGLMLGRLAARAVARGDHAVWLEVREGNAPARALYRRCGFIEHGLRKHYYPAPGGREHAVVMGLVLDDAPARALIARAREDDDGLV